VTRESPPISLVVGPRDECNGKRFREAMEGIRVKYGKGRPGTRPGEIAEDSAYNTRDARAYLRRMGVKASMSVNIRDKLGRGKGDPTGSIQKHISG